MAAAGHAYGGMARAAPGTIQIVRAHARDLTMAAAGHAYGMARAAPGITRLVTGDNCRGLQLHFADIYFD